MGRHALSNFITKTSVGRVENDRKGTEFALDYRVLNVTRRMIHGFVNLRR